ncbi:MAG TPA: hypothetical protein VGR87_10075 [Candidatus Limnocylindria bacterium]|jgi:hypothetical protein|nr:hypothetical protein [Candidatus Limnocylindria bacterium]
MVDALHEAHRVLGPHGLLVDARPDSRVLAHAEHVTPRGFRSLGLIATAAAELGNDRASDRAVAAVVREGLFRSRRRGRFWHRVHFAGLAGLQDYLDDHLRFVHRVRWKVDPATRRRLRHEPFVIRRAVRYEVLERR